MERAQTYDPTLTSMVSELDALQQNRTGAKTPEEAEANLAECERLTKRIGDFVATAILRDLRASQGLPTFVSRK